MNEAYEGKATRNRDPEAKSLASTPGSAPPRRGWRPWAIAGLLVLALAGGAGYLAWGGNPQASYLTVPVKRGTVAKSVIATGTVNPDTVVQVGTYVSGVIQALHCDYNTKVTVGQLCAEIDARPYRPVVEQATANHAIAKAQLGKDRAGLAYAKLVYERNVRLFQRENASKDAVDNAKSAYDQAMAQVALDEATIAQRKAALDAAQVNLDYTRITSPVDGTVVSRSINVGQTVAASFQTPTLFLIANDLTKMQVDANVTEADIGEVAVGNKARFTVEAFPDRPFEGRVTQIRQAPITVQNVVTYDVVIGASNPDLLLKPGMTATTRIITAERDGVLMVPDQALRFSPAGVRARSRPAGDGAPASRKRVWVLRDGKPAPVSISVGLDDNTNVELSRGDLREGDQVIVALSRPGTGGARRAPSSGPRMFGLR